MFAHGNHYGLKWICLVLFIHFFSILLHCCIPVSLPLTPTETERQMISTSRQIYSLCSPRGMLFSQTEHIPPSPPKILEIYTCLFILSLQIKHTHTYYITHIHTYGIRHGHKTYHITSSDSDLSWQHIDFCSAAG